MKIGDYIFKTTSGVIKNNNCDFKPVVAHYKIVDILDKCISEKVTPYQYKTAIVEYLGTDLSVCDNRRNVYFYQDVLPFCQIEIK